jgi:hypothetical protein
VNRGIKQQWLDALRSGDYKQGQGSLRPTPDTYCCLGVLCDLHAKETGNTWDGKGYCTQVLEVPDEVVIWAGLNWCDPRVEFKDKGASLSTLNDDQHLCFREIADVIERSL